jgi:hypothetical protein
MLARLKLDQRHDIVYLAEALRGHASRGVCGRLDSLLTHDKNGVSIGPGATVLTVAPREPISCAKARVKSSNGAFAPGARRRRAPYIARCR